MTQVDAVVGHHMNPYASGVARFNQMLAAQLGVSYVSLSDPVVDSAACPLFSFKVSEFDGAEEQRLSAVVEAAPALAVFFHNYCDLPLEQRMVARAQAVYCGNAEIASRLPGAADKVVTAWAPGLIVDRRQFKPASLTVFSFGMAHKVRTDMFGRLRDLLDATGETYAVYMSNANHATATLREAESVHDQMREVFSHDFFFMGNLSDVAISNQLGQSTFFAAFFEGGARANNTSLLSAMEHGAVVITNLDEHSPAQFRHLDNVIDIAQADSLPSDPLVLTKLRVRAMETAQELSWERLVDVVKQS